VGKLDYTNILIEKKDEFMLVTFELRHGDSESIDRLVVSKEKATTYGEDKSKNHAELIDEMYSIQDEDWRDGEIGDGWIDVSYAEGIARVRSVEPISNHDVEILRKHGVA